jgi:hypothetical protein
MPAAAGTQKDENEVEWKQSNAAYRIHCCHTHASLLLKAGEYPKVISERLGHSQIGITMDMYSHIMPGMQKQAAEKIDMILAGRILFSKTLFDTSIIKLI